MAGGCGKCCGAYLFFSYAGATVVYLILGIFANTGNISLLMEHCRKEGDTITLKEKEDVKQRTYLQYYSACGLSLILSIILYIFCMAGSSQKETKRMNYQDINLDMKTAQGPLLDDSSFLKTSSFNKDQALFQDLGLHAVNTIDSKKGMTENEI